jgi:hypothetical protein
MRAHNFRQRCRKGPKQLAGRSRLRARKGCFHHRTDVAIVATRNAAAALILDAQVCDQ